MDDANHDIRANDGRHIADIWDVHWSIVHAYLQDQEHLCAKKHTEEATMATRGNACKTSDTGTIRQTDGHHTRT